MNIEQLPFEIWRTSWQAAALIVLVLVAQWLCGQRLSPRWRYNLWLIVVLRLLLPVSPESSFSLFNLVQVRQSFVAMPVPLTKEAGEVPPPERNRTSDASSGAVEKVATSKVVETPGPGVQTALADAESKTASSIPTSPQRVSGPRDWPWSRIALSVWLAGVAGLGIQLGWVTLRTFRRARQAVPITDPSVLAMLAQCQVQMDVRTPLRIFETPILQSPALFGFLRPVLLLPPGFIKSFSAAELRHVFMHELAHVVRRDLVWSWLLTILQIVHWFNPAIWFGFSRMRADRELACDALALGRSGEGEAKPYGTTIIKLLESMARPTGSTPFVGILESRNQMTRRIRMIAAFRPSRRWSFLALALMGILAVTGLTDAVRNTHPQEADSGATIKVKIVDLATGLPITGALVYSPYGDHIVFSEAPKPMMTDRQGVLELPRQNLERGMGMFVTHPDYAPAVLATNWYRPANMPPQPKIPVPEECTLSLRRGRTLGGTVQDAEGRPLAGVRVEMRSLYSPTRANDDTTPMQYPGYHPLFVTVPATDEKGVWNVTHFPDQLEDLQIDFVRPDGSVTRFSTPSETGRAEPGGKRLDIQEFHRGLIATTLPEGIAVRGMVRDASGKPLPGITVTESDRRRAVGHAIQTDADGRFELPNRDPHQILLTVTGAGWAIAAEVVAITPGMPEVEVRMQPAKPLVVRVQDEDGKPLSNASLIPELKLGWNGKAGSDGRVSWDVAPQTPVEYQIYAEGHRLLRASLAATGSEQIVTLVRSRPGDKDEPDDASVAKPAGAGPALAAFESTFLLQDGRPVANTGVSIYDPAIHKDRWTSVDVFFKSRPRVSSQRGQTSVRTDVSGRASLPAMSGNSEILIVHEGGYLIATAAEVRQHPRTKLTAWGRVQGNIKLNGQPLANHRLSLQSKTGGFPPGLQFSNSATTDAGGNFEFEMVPAGTHNLYRTSPSDGQWPQSNPLLVNVRSGESTLVPYEISGRVVVGKLRMDPPEADFDWTKNKGSVLLKRARVRPPSPSFYDFVRYADYRKATDRWSAGLATNFQDTYGGTMEPDGSFRFEGVPSGDFELTIEATQEENRQRKELGSLSHSFSVAADQPARAQDLGTLNFRFKDRTLSVKPLLDFDAVDLSGRPLRMADLRGKYVLVNFWASWAPMGAEKLGLLKELAANGTADAKFVILNVSLDESADVAHTSAEAQGLPGLQCRLEGPARSAVTETLRVDDLPTMIFVGPDGRVRARALSENRWKTTITSALAL